MTPVPLGEFQLSPGRHRSALWWLGLLYRKPQEFRERLSDLPWRRQLVVGAWLYLHALPYLLVLIGLGRWFLAGSRRALFEITLVEAFATGFRVGLTSAAAVVTLMSLNRAFSWLLRRRARGRSHPRRDADWVSGPLTVGLTFGLFGGFAFWLADGLANDLSLGLAGGLVAGLTLWPAEALADSIVEEVAVGLTGGLTAGLVFWIILPSAAFGLPGVLAFGLTYTVVHIRLYYFPAHLVLIWPRPRPAWYHAHPVAWDDCCWAPFPALDRLLVAYAEEEPVAGQAEIDRLIDHYASQRQAALRAQVILIARRAGRLTHLARLDDVLAGLPEGHRGFLAETRRVRELAHEITLKQAHLDTLDRPFLRKPHAELLVKEVEEFRQRIAGFRQPLARELRQAAGAWLERGRQQLQSA